jgi:hypothetical protein
LKSISENPTDHDDDRFFPGNVDFQEAQVVPCCHALARATDFQNGSLEITIGVVRPAILLEKELKKEMKTFDHYDL